MNRVEIEYLGPCHAESDGMEGFYHAYVTDDVDTWGKRTILIERADRTLITWYLFPDEWRYASEDNS